jgi:hypothetical protein
MKWFHKKTKFLFSICTLLVQISISGQSFSEGFENIANLTDWLIQNNSFSPGSNWGQGNSTVFSAQAGTANSYLSANYQSTSSPVGTISNWLFTPTRTYNNGDVVTFYTRTASGPVYPDRLEVRFSAAGNGTDCGTTPTSVGTFTTLLLSINPILTTLDYPQVWTQYTITISGLSGATNGRIAFRYYVTDGGASGSNSNFIGIDSYTYTSVAQPPSNDQCSGAIPLNYGTTCNLTNGSVAYATESLVGCSGSANNDVWYSFTANTTSASISVVGSNSFDAVYEVFTDNCANLISLSCIDIGVEGESESGVINDLNIGQTYYIRVYDWLDDIPNTMTFGICVEQFIQCSLQQPTGSTSEAEICGNDLNGGCNAIPPVYQSINCGETIFGSSWATGGNRDLDWYKFNLNSPGFVTLSAQAEFPFYIYLVDYSNCANPVIVSSGNFNACQSGTVSYDFTNVGSYAAVIAPALFEGYACGTNNDYILSINLPSDTAQINAGSTSICPNSTTDLTGYPLSNYTWYLNGSSFFTGSTVQVSQPGTYTATYTDINGCSSGSNSLIIQALPSDNATFAYPSNTVCVGSSNILPISQINGVYTANALGLVFTNTASGEIDMTNSIEGNYLVTFQTNGICPASSTQSFVITSNPDASFSYAAASYCQSDGNQDIILGSNGSVGTFSSNSSNINVSSSTGQISPSQSELGVYTIYNSIIASGSCPEVIDSFMVEIQGPVINFPDPGIFCPSENATLLTATPTGGVYSGNSIINNEFIPSLGSCLVTYVVVDQNGCIDSASQLVTVEVPSNLVFGQYPELCSNGNSISLDLGSPAGGYYTGLGVSGSSFFPNQGVLGSNILSYNYISSNGCPDSIAGIVVVNESPTVSFEPVPNLCDTADLIPLQNVNPLGGVFTGAGIVNQTYFDPTIAGIGTHEIIYSYTANGCSSSATQLITVDQCSNIDEYFISLSMYPNPVINSFKLVGVGVDDVEKIEIYSMGGKFIQIINNHHNEFDISQLPQSNYLVKINYNNQTYFLKLIKI